MKKLCHYLSKYLGVLVLAAAVLALIFPSVLQQIRPTVINYLLGVVMFGMGLTLNLHDFKIVFSRPKDVIIGCLAQFTVMPLLAWGLARAFQLDEALALGVVLVGCCPGGTASNVITYLAKGDLALSVGMTGVSTMLAPLLTPLLTWALAGKSVNVDVVGMLLSILWVVILPIVVGLIVKGLWPKFTERATDYLPAFSSVAIALIVAIIIAANASKLMAGGIVIVIVVMLHNLCGLSLGYLIGRLLGLSDPKKRAISIEVGMQNSGLASSLATIHFAAYPMATIPGAIFSVWHNISGAMVARLYTWRKSNSSMALVVLGFLCMTVLLFSACSQRDKAVSSDTTSVDSLLCPMYATGYQVKSLDGMRLVDVGNDHHFALVTSDDMMVPDGYTKVHIPIKSTICMTALQLSNFTILDAHDVVKGLTGTKNLFNKDILQRVKDGRIVKIGTEGNFDIEMVLAANPDVIFISPFKRGGYDAIKETGITLVPHLGYKELNPLGQAEWIKFVGMFIGKEKEACEVFAGIEQRYNELKDKTQHVDKRPTVTSGEMHYGNWHAVGGKNYLAQIFRDAGADYVIHDEETAGEDLEFEKMYELAASADYWRILNSYPGEFSYEALKASEPRNELFKAFKERKVIYCNMKTTPYYEISPVEPDVLLKDFVAIFHPELVEADYTPTFYYLLK